MRFTHRSLVLGCSIASLSACPSAPGTDETTFTTFNNDSVEEETGDGDGDPSGDGDGDPGGVCGDAVVDDGEVCDLGPQNSASGQCTPDCQIADCGDGYVYEGFEECDDGNQSNNDACVDQCKLATCGDGHLQTGVEMCDDANDDEADGCNSMCLPGSCGDGIVQDGEQCDDGNRDNSDQCPACQLAFCGDGHIQAGLEECDDGNALDNDGCLPVFCTEAECGDGFVYEGVEECDDANDVDDDICDNACELNIIACQNGAVNLATSPNSDMVVCDDPNDGTCEEDGETLCPVGWGLCSREQYINRNDGWNYVPASVVVAEIHCRGGGGAGHYTLSGTLSTDQAFNCSYGSSRDTCPSNYGCNELAVHVLCCAPTPSCGNGVVDDVEELCDDGNVAENDACLNSCAPRLPGC